MKDNKGIIKGNEEISEELKGKLEKRYGKPIFEDKGFLEIAKMQVITDQRIDFLKSTIATLNEHLIELLNVNSDRDKSVDFKSKKINSVNYQNDCAYLERAKELIEDHKKDQTGYIQLINECVSNKLKIQKNLKLYQGNQMPAIKKNNVLKLLKKKPELITASSGKIKKIQKAYREEFKIDDYSFNEYKKQNLYMNYYMDADDKEYYKKKYEEEKEDNTPKTTLIYKCLKELKK
jgi:hypothetical protein